MGARRARAAAAGRPRRRRQLAYNRRRPPCRCPPKSLYPMAAAVAGLSAAALGVCLSGRLSSASGLIVGERVPEATLFTMKGDERVKLQTSGVFAPGKTVVLFALPGAFTPG